jgi:putative chitinase
LVERFGNAHRNSAPLPASGGCAIIRRQPQQEEPMINRTFFFDQANLGLFGGKLFAKVTGNLDQILDYWEKNSPEADDRWLAYALGTAHHETDHTFGPIREYGLGKGKKYYPYYGRGLVQLTWDYNYKKLGKQLNVDLINNPDLALQLKYAIPIMFDGMQQGIFTGKKLADYFNKTKEDWVNARRIINGLDKANSIAQYAKRYYAAISYTTA